MLESQLEALATSARQRIDAASNPEELEAVRVEVLGSKGARAEVSKGMGKLTPDDRARIGKLLNGAKTSLETALDTRLQSFASQALAQRLDAEWLDVTLPAPGTRPGALHPLTRIQQELEDLFTSMGVAVLDGPEVESEYNNFDALNIPPDHPARDMQDTFWLAPGQCLRTHTSPVQVRCMAKLGPPLLMISAVRVCLNDEVDASHGHPFY